MCLAVPGELLSIDASDALPVGRVRFGGASGIVREVQLAYVPDASEGDWLLVHVGFAISVVDAGEAARVLSYLDEIGETMAGAPVEDGSVEEVP